MSEFDGCNISVIVNYISSTAIRILNTNGTRKCEEFSTHAHFQYNANHLFCALRGKFPLRTAHSTKLDFMYRMGVLVHVSRPRLFLMSCHWPRRGNIGGFDAGAQASGSVLPYPIRSSPGVSRLWDTFGSVSGCSALLHVWTFARSTCGAPDILSACRRREALLFSCRKRRG